MSIISLVQDVERLGALDAYRILDTSEEQAFDDLAHLAAELCDTAVALVSFVDANRQWFKARVAFPSCQTDLQSSVCKYVLAEADLLVIPDLTQDPRTVDNPLVTGDPRIRFYAGAPLITSHGHVLGSLCAIDTSPRPQGLTPRQSDNLRRLARQVVAQLETRRAMAERNVALEQRADAAVAHAAGEARWRELFEQLREGIVVGEALRDAQGEIVDWRYLQVNPAWADLVGVDGPGVIGRTIRNVLPGVEQEWIDLARVVDGDGMVTFTRQVGQLERWYEGRASAVDGDTFIVMFLEVTDRVRATTALTQSTNRRAALSELGDCLRASMDVGAMSHASGSIVGRTLGACRAGFGSVDSRRETVEIPKDWFSPVCESIAGTHSFRDFGSYVDDLRAGRIVVVADVRIDARTREHAQAWLGLSIGAFINVPVIEKGELVAVSYAHYETPHEITSEDQAFVQSAADRTRAAVARLRSEESQALLNGEINHRLKNTLAMVQAIAAQTLKGASDRSAVLAFNARLQALGAAHDVLLSQDWVKAGLSEIVARALKTASAEDRTTVHGPPIALGARAALSTSLLIHELATNAQKHGSLSGEGEVTLTWRLEDTEHLVLEWLESGGPPTHEPLRKGFGSRLLRMGLIGAGAAELSYKPEGLHAAFRARLKQLEEA